MQTPLIDALLPLSALDTRFFVPGHKANPAAQPLFGAALRYDLTEIPGADDLSRPAGPILASEQNMARVFGAGATLYSAFGASCCVKAMLTLFLRPGARVIMARNCHVSAVAALAFVDAAPHWLWPAPGENVGVEQVREALRLYPGAPVYLTSPDYYGQTADIGAVAALCRACGSPLLVDGAQGCHLKFLSPDAHPLTLGADAVVDSAHKTLFCLTGAALLHLRAPALAPAARAALNLYGSTSPAYPVLMSLDYAAGLLLEAPPDYPGAAARLAALAARHAHLVQPSKDPLRLCLYPAGGGWLQEEVLAALAKAGIHPEYADGSRIVLLASPFTGPAEYEALNAALERFSPRPPLACPPAVPAAPPAVHCPVRQALLGPVVRLAVSNAVGRVAAEAAAPCPPGVPVVAPGEIISAAAAEAMLAGGIQRINVVE